MSVKTLIIGSRGSDLALWQANFIKSQLEGLGANVVIKIIKTQGDNIQHLAFDKMEGKGFFTKEIEEALIRREIDLAVHSHKDLESTNPEGLMIAAVSEREDPSELFLIRKDSVEPSAVLNLKMAAIVGTSSARRKSELLALRSDIILKDIRGNVPTRINKLRNGEYDAIMLARAGVTRLQLNIDDLEALILDPKEFIPAPAQGVMAVQIRVKNIDLFLLLQKLNHRQVQDLVGIERKVLKLMEGGCQTPLGVYCTKDTVGFHVYASIASAWNTTPKKVKISSDSLEGLAEKVVAELKGK